jgi:hypothetical protein
MPDRTALVTGASPACLVPEMVFQRPGESI